MMNLEEVFEKTLILIKECSTLLKNTSQELDEQSKKDGTLITKYDLIVDQKLTQELKKIVNYPILSEEHEENIGDTYFVIDPIDGTHNFSRGFEYFGIMVAFVEKEETLFSIIDMPMLNKTYTALKGKGAFLNGVRIYLKKRENRLIGNINLSKQNCLEYIAKMMKSKYRFEFRSICSTGVSVCYVANGILDFAIQIGRIGIWDIVPPKLIIEEAGGVCDVSKYDKEKYSIIAGEKELVETIKDMIYK